MSDSNSSIDPEDRPKMKDPRAVARGKKGGLVGGRRRAAKLTAKERSDIARKAAEARWRRG